jgi:hypothetical protein
MTFSYDEDQTGSLISVINRIPGMEISLYPGSLPVLLEQPNSHTAGIRVAMIEHNGITIELIEFENNKKIDLTSD